MPELIMMIGLPGSGKSTWIKHHHLNYFDHVVISSDNIIEQLGAPEGLNYADAFNKYSSQAFARMKKELKDALADKKNIIWDQTNLTVRSRRKKLKGIPDDYSLMAVAFEIDSNELLRRRGQRESEDGKTIPWRVLKNMEEQYVRPSKLEGFEKIRIIKV